MRYAVGGWAVAATGWGVCPTAAGGCDQVASWMPLRVVATRWPHGWVEAGPPRGGGTAD